MHGAARGPGPTLSSARGGPGSLGYTMTMHLFHLPFLMYYCTTPVGRSHAVARLRRLGRRRARDHVRMSAPSVHLICLKSHSNFCMARLCLLPPRPERARGGRRGSLFGWGLLCTQHRSVRSHSLLSLRVRCQFRFESDGQRSVGRGRNRKKSPELLRR